MRKVILFIFCLNICQINQTYAESCFTRGFQKFAQFFKPKVKKPFLSEPNNLFSAKVPSTNFETKNINRKMIHDLNLYRIKEIKGKIMSLDQRKMNDLFMRIKEDKTAGICQLTKYDPKGDMGFCFGRAAVTHIEALRSGVNKDSIKKIWVTADHFSSFKDLKNEWRYHVVTAIKGKNGSWWVFDPIKFDKPVMLEVWEIEMRKMSQNHPFNMFITQPRRLGPGTKVPTYLTDKSKIAMKRYQRMDTSKLNEKSGESIYSSTDLRNKFFYDYLKKLKKAILSEASF